MKRSLFVAGLLLVLSGCTVATPAPAETPIEAVETFATENQVAAVVAEYEPKWREVIEDAGDCRFIWVLGGADFAEEVQGDICFIQEKTIGITSQLVTRDLNALDVPESMTDLVRETTDVLAEISSIDLERACGEEKRPAEGDVCNAALGGRNMAYNRLESLLDKWKPYLG